MSACPNPFAGEDGWYWHDETGDIYGPFKTEAIATKRLLRYINFMEHGPTLWDRIRLSPIKLALALRRFWKDESSGHARR